MGQETFSVKCDKLVISRGVDVQWTKFRNKKLNQKANELVVVESGFRNSKHNEDPSSSPYHYGYPMLFKSSLYTTSLL